MNDGNNRRYGGRFKDYFIICLHGSNQRQTQADLRGSPGVTGGMLVGEGGRLGACQRGGSSRAEGDDARPGLFQKEVRLLLLLPQSQPLTPEVERRS